MPSAINVINFWPYRFTVFRLQFVVAAAAVTRLCLCIDLFHLSLRLCVKLFASCFLRWNNLIIIENHNNFFFHKHQKITNGAQKITAEKPTPTHTHTQRKKTMETEQQHLKLCVPITMLMNGCHVLIATSHRFSHILFISALKRWNAECSTDYDFDTNQWWLTTCWFGLITIK